MNKQVASEVVDLMIELGDKLNHSVSLVQSSCTENEFTVYRRAVANIMGSILLDVMNPIIDEHPDLKPNKLE